MSFSVLEKIILQALNLSEYGHNVSSSQNGTILSGQRAYSAPLVVTFVTAARNEACHCGKRHQRCTLQDKERS